MNDKLPTALLMAVTLTLGYVAGEKRAEYLHRAEIARATGACKAAIAEGEAHDSLAANFWGLSCQR